MSEPDLEKTWDDHYEGLEAESALRDMSFFEMEVRAIVERLCAEAARMARRPLHILELGSGTGFLAQAILAALGERHVLADYEGVDFSEVAIDRARSRGLERCRFTRADFLARLAEEDGAFDIVVTQRSVMALLEPAAQTSLLERIRARLAPTGVGLLSEGSAAALAGLRRMREQLGVPGEFERVWHSRYLDEDELRRVFGRVEVVDFSSTYWLVTRVIYPYFEDPKHNTPLHRFAASLPQTGEMGLVKLFVVRP